MSFLSVFLIAIGLAMDAFAVSICNGLSLKTLKPRHALTFGLYFGFFQFIMPVIGFFLGQTFNDYIKAYDHWVAFGLLSIIGGKMLIESFEKNNACTVSDDSKIMSVQNLTMNAIATSIDAMAVGISFALTDVDIWMSAIVIGVIAFAFSFGGVYLGKRVGSLFQKSAERLGGIVLIGIGIKILIEHLIA